MLTLPVLPVPNDYAKGGTPTARRARGDGRGLGLTGIIAGQGACKGGDRRSSVSRIGTLLRPIAFCVFLLNARLNADIDVSILKGQGGTPGVWRRARAGYGLPSSVAER